MKPRLIGLLLLTAVMPASASQIITSALCAVNRVVEVHPRSCAVEDATGVVWSTADVREGMSSPFEYQAGVAVDVTAGILPDSDGQIHGSAQAELHGLFTTEGPVRDGFIHLSVFFFLEGNDPAVPATWRVGPYSGDKYDVFDKMLPLELGQTFMMDVWNSYSFERPIPGRDSLVWHTVAGNFAFTLYEADGVTPVALIPLAIPEPGGTALSGLATLALLALRRYCRSRRLNKFASSRYAPGTPAGNCR